MDLLAWPSHASNSGDFSIVTLTAPDDGELFNGAQCTPSMTLRAASCLWRDNQRQPIDGWVITHG